MDGNAHASVGVGYFVENTKDGKRQTSAAMYSLDGVTLLTDTLIERVFLENANDGVEVTGVLAGGKTYQWRNVICCADAIRSPQILLLSGIGPKETLEKLGIETKVDLPEVGQHLTDHLAMYQFFKLKDPSQGYALGSANPLFSRPEYGAGMPCDILAWTDLPRKGLIETITKDEGAAPDPKTHPLLRQPRAHLEPAIVFMAMSQDPPINLDGTHIWSILMPFLPTSRRSVSINTIDPATYPVIDLNWLATEVDRYACRAAIRRNTRLMLNSSFGCGIIEGETPPAGIRPVSLDDDDEYLDMRARQSAV